MINKLLLVGVVALLTGCASESRFDCPYSKGPSCMSMDKIDAMIKTNGSEGSTNARENTGRLAMNDEGYMASPRTSNAIRVPEKVMQLWVAPYESESGIYYHSAYINVIVRDPYWKAPLAVGGNV
jgi:hypothetical protein